LREMLDSKTNINLIDQTRDTEEVDLPRGIGRQDPGFGLQVVATILLIVATLVAVVWLVVATGPSAVAGVVDGARNTAGAVTGTVQSVGDWTDRLQAIAASVPPEEVLVPVPEEGSESLLITVAGDDGAGVAFALLAGAPSGETTLVLAPPALLGIQPGYGDFPLADSLRFEGPELAALTLTNLLGIRIDNTLGLSVGDLAAALPAELEVDLPSPLIIAEGGEGRIEARSGKVARPAALAERVLVTQGEGDQLEWLQRQGAIWAATLLAIDDDAAVAERLAQFASGDHDSVAELLEAAARGTDFTLTALPVSRVSIGGNGAGYAIDGKAAGPFVLQRLGHLALLEGPRPRVELLNGNGRIGTTRLVAQELVRRGFRVIKTDNANSFQFETTQVIAQGRENRLVAEEVIDLLGSGELLMEVRTPSGVVDISVIVGADVPAGEG